ncbi:hypothetical protein GT23_2478 [Parageobacillus thermoglucosidasius]|nr:hypothetical protein GT23_2478 [Parageobacillus thermoglucosidasius]
MFGRKLHSNGGVLKRIYRFPNKEIAWRGFNNLNPKVLQVFKGSPIVGK